MKRSWRNGNRAAVWSGAVGLGLLLPLSLVAEPPATAKTVVVPIGRTTTVLMISRKPIASAKYSGDDVLGVQLVEGDPTRIHLTGRKTGVVHLDLTDADGAAESYDVTVQAQPAAAEPVPTAAAPRPGSETRNPDDFELFLEGVLEAPRGRVVPGAFVPACKAGPGCCDTVRTDRKATTPVAEVHWRTDYRKARDEAKEQARPLILVFRSASCPWCDKLEAAIREDAEASKFLNESTVPVELSADANQALADALRIDAYPTIVVAAADGKILIRLTGYRDAANLKKEIQEGLEKNVVNTPALTVPARVCAGH